MVHYPSGTVYSSQLLLDNNYLGINLDILASILDQGYQPRICYFDAGISSSLSINNQKNFLDLFYAIVENRGRDAAILMIEKSRPALGEWYDIFYQKDNIDTKCRNSDGFIKKIEQIVNDVSMKSLKLESISLESILKKVLNAARYHHVKIESDFTPILISLMIVEGIGRQLDPNLDLLEVARLLLNSKKIETFNARYKLKLFLQAKKMFNAEMADKNPFLF